MPKLLALEWDQRHLGAVEADVGRNGPRIGRALRWQWPSQLDPLDSPEEAGLLLQQQLQQHGFRAREALVALGRNEVVVRRLQLPAVPDEELPAVVRLQAEMKVSTAIDSLLLDFLPLPAQGEENQREVLLVEAPREKVEAIQAVLSQAGLEVAQVSITPVALAELLLRTLARQGTEPKQAELLIWPAQGRFEISVVQERHLIFSHCVPTAHEPAEEDILAEIQRTLGAVLRSDPQLAIAQARLVAGPGEHEALRALVPQRLGYELQELDPLQAVRWRVSAEQTGSHATWAGAVGMLWAAGEMLSPPLDLLHPRREPAPRNTRRQRLLAAGAAAALLLGGVYGWVQYQAGGLEQQIQLAQQDINQLEQNLKQSQHVPRHAQAVGQWTGTRVDWLGQLHHLAQLLEEQQPRQAYLTELRVLPLSGSSDGPAARVQGAGRAASRAAVLRLYQRLAEEGYRVHPRAIVPEDQRERFSWRFELDLEVPPTRANAAPSGPTETASSSQQAAGS